ncbi:hypothetical protein M2271_007898 [Streptomyces sp. LBL]|nr:hypothetical protein [Streptomyces sp. LBL]
MTPTKIQELFFDSPLGAGPPGNGAIFTVRLPQAHEIQATADWTYDSLSKENSS